MRKLSERLSNYLITENQFTGSNKNFDIDVIRFGIETILSLFYGLIAILLVAYFFGVFVPTLWFLGIVNLLRAFTGGAHCSSSTRCTVMGAFSMPLLAFICINYLNITNIYIYYIIALIGFGFLLKYAPKDNPHKPITNESYKKKLRSLAIIIYCIVILLSSFLLGSYKDLILLGAIWQIFTITPFGEIFVREVDKLLEKIGV